MRKVTMSMQVLALALLAGCSSSQSVSTTTTPTPTQTSQEVFRVGMECNYAPFNWTTVEKNDTAQKISEVDYCDGYDVVMATKIAEKMNRQVQIVKTDWDNLILSLNNHEIDAIIAGMTATEERSQVVDFTEPYYVSEEVIIVKKDSPLVNIKNIQELSGHTVMGQLNTLYDEIIDQIQGVNHATPLDNYPAMVNALQHGEVEALTAELPVAQGVVSANPDLTYVTFEKGNGFESDSTVSVAIAKDNPDLLKQVQEALNTISVDERNQLMLDAVNRQPASN